MVSQHNNEDLFRKIASVTSESLKKILEAYLQSKYNCVKSSDGYIYAIGDIPITLVAHLDTVFEPPIDIYFDQEKQVMFSPQGLGGDDRAGVYAIIKLLQDDYRPSVLFTLGEELGGLGAQEFVMDFPSPLTPTNYLIELDRRGKRDCVFYDCENAAFKQYIVSYGGFKEAFGSFSDISFICPIWNLAGVNLSIGYQYEHTRNEILNFNHLYATLNKVKHMLATTNKQYLYKEVKYGKRDKS